jgi:hypothetical protein
MSKGKVVVSGILFWFPLAGVTYQFLHYLIPLRRLGYDVYYIEDPSQWIYNARIHDVSPDASENVAAIAPILEAHGFKDRWAFRGNYEGGRSYGMSAAQIARLYREADVLLNVTGQEVREEHLACRRRIYVESDPFSFQVRAALGHEATIRHLSAHDMHFTFGENLGAPDCAVPTAGYTWLPTRQPVVLDLWRAVSGPRQTYRTITTWSNRGKNIEYNGDTYYWTKDREFEKFIDLPQRRRGPFELATRVDEATRARLESHGWRIVDSFGVSAHMDAYRDYIGGSRGEFTVARDQYVRPNTGWFSDRSACYLAAGRPVITQETGFSKFLPTGRGLYAFSTCDELLAAIDAVESDYEGNCRAAGEIAAECFDADKVVGSLMQRAGL